MLYVFYIYKYIYENVWNKYVNKQFSAHDG